MLLSMYRLLQFLVPAVYVRPSFFLMSPLRASLSAFPTFVSGMVSTVSRRSGSWRTEAPLRRRKIRLGKGEAFPFLQTYVCADALAERGVRHAYDRRVLDVRMGTDHMLDGDRANRLPAAKDRLLDPARYRHRPRFVDPGQIARLEKPVRREDCFVVLFGFKIAGENVRAFCDQLPFAVGRQRLPVLVDHLVIRIGTVLLADGGANGLDVGVEARHRAEAFGSPQGVHEFTAYFFVNLLTSWVARRAARVNLL